MQVSQGVFLEGITMVEMMTTSLFNLRFSSSKWFFFRGCCGFCEIVECDVFRRVGKGNNSREEGGGNNRGERRDF